MVIVNCILSCVRIVVYIWRTLMPLKGWRCGGKAAGDPIYKHLGLEESKILLSVCTYRIGVNIDC